MPLQNMNQFKQTQIVGTLDLSSNINNALTCRFRYDDGSSDTLLPGEGVKIVDLGANDSVGPPIIDERALDADVIFGIKLYTPKKNTSEVGEIVQIAQPGDIVNMNSGAAILRGANVSLVLATPGNVVTTTAEAILGIALDKVAGANEIVRVKIKEA